MADLDFFFDPVCPWAWITSRWVSEVEQHRNYDVEWRFISLAIVNEELVADWYTPEYKAGHRDGLRGLRIADAVRLAEGNEGVARFYTAAGTSIHTRGERDSLKQDARGFYKAALGEAGLDEHYVDAMDDDSHDAYIRSDTALALERAGKGLGTPILTFHPGQPDEGSFFGPVMPRIPRGEEAAKLWDAIELIATTCEMAELKRGFRSKPRFD
jgi:2-hydroxychromene-2-carboxylate isomerase